MFAIPLLIAHVCTLFVDGNDLGNKLLIWCRYIIDKRKEKGSVCLHKEWANIPEPFAYQTTVRDITAFAPEFRERVTTLKELFPPKSHCFILSTPHYGSLAEVSGVFVEATFYNVAMSVAVGTVGPS